MQAEEQNTMLAEDQLPQVLDTDDHATHIYTHYQVQPKTWAVWFHIAEHQQALAKQVAQQQQQAMLESQPTGAPGASPSTPGQSGGQMPSNNPMQAASPLQAEAATPMNINQ
jgi:hypothetical protein